MKFHNSTFWKNYKSYKAFVGNSSTRSTVDGVVYWKLITKYSPKNILEVGVYQRLTSGLLLEFSPAAKLLGIDPMLELDIFNKIYSDDVKSRSNFIEQKIEEVTLTDFFDFILLDGDHKFEFVYNDLLKCIPQLSKDGILAIDDYAWPGVDAAIVKMVSKNFGLVPFLQTEQTEFWHYPQCDRSDFLDDLFTDPLSNIIMFYNIERFGNTVLKAKTVNALTDNISLFDSALKIYNV